MIQIKTRTYEIGYEWILEGWNHNPKKNWKKYFGDNGNELLEQKKFLGKKSN